MSGKKRPSIARTILLFALILITAWTAMIMHLALQESRKLASCMDPQSTTSYCDFKNP